MDELVRTINNSPLYIKPEITKINFPNSLVTPELSVDGLRIVMKIIISVYETNSSEYQNMSDLLKNSNHSRIMTELFFEKAVLGGLVARDSSLYYKLTEKGKKYAVDNNLI